MNPHRGFPEDITEAYFRGLMHSVGYRRKDLDKPQIVVVNSWTDVNPGHQPLREVASGSRKGSGPRADVRPNSACRPPATAWPRVSACTTSFPSGI